jgi:hypothetical protein
VTGPRPTFGRADFAAALFKIIGRSVFDTADQINYCLVKLRSRIPGSNGLILIRHFSHVIRQGGEFLQCLVQFVFVQIAVRPGECFYFVGQYLFDVNASRSE